MQGASRAPGKMPRRTRRVEGRNLMLPGLVIDRNGARAPGSLYNEAGE